MIYIISIISILYLINICYLSFSLNVGKIISLKKNPPKKITIFIGGIPTIRIWVVYSKSHKKCSPKMELLY